STTHRYLDDNPTATPQDDYTVLVKVTDNQGGVGQGSGKVTVKNVDPTITEFGLTPAINENGVASLGLAFVDPGTVDSHNLQVDWGDGHVENFQSTGTRFFFVSHQFLDDNPTGTPSDNYTVKVRLTDDDGPGAAETSGIVTVHNVAPSNMQASL